MLGVPATPAERAGHWDAAYDKRGVEGVSWFQAAQQMSLAFIEALGVPADAAIIDVGGGASLSRPLLGRRPRQGVSTQAEAPPT